MQNLSILFGRPWLPHATDDRFELEALAAEELDIEYASIPLDPIVNGDAERALRHLPRPRDRRWLYRGWMLSSEEYAELYAAVLERDEELVVDPESFEQAHYLPNWVPLLGAKTAPSVWTMDPDPAEAWELAQELGAAPWLIKDHVKSAKEYWHRACYVPADTDRERFLEICEELLDVRGDRFERGFAVRKYLELAPTGHHTPERSVPEEYRLIFWEGQLVAHAAYADVDITLERPQQFARLGELIDSPFFTADVARLKNGGFTVIEINDGGCSTLPEQLDPRSFYRALSDI